MKRTIISLTLTMLTLILILAACAHKTTIEAEPSAFRTADVEAFCKDSDVSIIVTSDGEMWEMDYVARLDEADPSKSYVVFDTEGTPDNIYDDSIVSVVTEP